MDHRYRPMRGTFVAVGHRADGGSVRFVPDRSADLDALTDTRRLRVARDGSVRVRLEGIDAPMWIDDERKQPLADEARKALLDALGFAGCALDDGIVLRAVRAEVRGEIVARAVDMEGNVIGYVGRALLDTLNARLLRDGFVYPLAYDTQPMAHRALFARLAADARSHHRGVWALDRTEGFDVERLDTHLIFPKLYRRCVAYAEDDGYVGSLRTWMRDAAAADNDVVAWTTGLVRWSELLAGDARVSAPSPLSLTFVAR